MSLSSVTVFIVEDEPLIRETLQWALEDGGFGVVTASNGEEATARLDAENRVFRALITDVNLGKGSLTGWQVARHARGLRADMPVVYMTGASAHEWSVHGVPKSMLLAKPFASAQVVTAVSQLLNAVGPGQP